MAYVGRFAPSPTGPLHFGSLVAALASFLDARHAGGTWLLRVEDLDPPRESEAAPDEIMSQLVGLGLHWDRDVLYQSTRLEAYEHSLTKLKDLGRAYPCTCTRKATPPVYQGTCRGNQFSEVSEAFSVRLLLHEEAIGFHDRVFGEQIWQPDSQVGDFIIKRKDGLFAYQLAVVVDDDFQNVNQIVRGFDLLDSTPRQLALYDALRIEEPGYLHIPILVDKSGDKLSKQAHARPIGIEDPMHQLRSALEALGQDPHTGVDTVADLLERAAKAWQTSRIPQDEERPAPSEYL